MSETMAVVLAAGKGTRMRSELPKVLHTVSGRPMIHHSIDRARAAGVGDIVVVVGYRSELVVEEVGGPGIRFVLQEEQLGTGHAVAQARPHLEGFEGDVVVLYGDMPLLSSEIIQALIARREEAGAAGVALTIELENPPDFGRIIRDAEGRILRVVEVKDANPEELAVREVNVGAYCFQAPALLEALGQLSDDNAQGEYYLTDVVGILVASGQVVDTVRTHRLEETLGVNDPFHLSFAEKIGDIEFAESMYELIDASLAMERREQGS